MSMLAEPRRKQKWSVDPRNSTWSNDDSKFGQKMLERMGWSKGKGLGRSEQGSTDHIKVNVKNNNYGLGANASHEDNWIAHQDEFNELLAQLNNHHGQNTSNDAPLDEKKGFSLEEKSKTSKKRVHYMKFTKGKDLSSRSETDLNCIFGKRAKSTKVQEQESSKSNSQSESEETGTPPEPDPESIAKTVTSTLNMQEYFARRMAQLKRARGAESSTPSVEEEPAETPGPAEEVSPAHCSDSDTERPRKKKKKKNNKKQVEEVVVVEQSSALIIVEQKENQEQESSRKKKKRKITEHNDKTENCSFKSVPEEETVPSKKKKLKKNKNREQLNRRDSTEHKTGECEVIQDEEINLKEEDVVKECDEALVAKKSKKKKRKRQNQE